MDKIQKFLLKLDAKFARKLADTFLKIRSLDVENLDVKKMKGEKNKYRVRIGKYRIIFVKGKEIGEIIDINTRGDIY